jgi:hypothetical protein
MGFFSKLLNQSQPAACVLSETHAVVRQIVGVLGYDVVATADYGSRLAPALNFAVEYFDKQIAQIPGPLDISAAHYMHHPLVHALFPARQEIAHGIGRSVEVKQPLAFLAGADQPEVFALLGVRRQKVPGGSGEPVFCDHTLRCLAATESGSRQGLRTAALARLVAAYGEHLEKLRKHEKLPRASWNIENRTDLSATEADKDAVALASEELQAEKMLRGIVAWLQRPGEHLQVIAESRTTAPADAAHQIEALPELQIRDRRHWLVCYVRFPTAEGVAAMHNEHGQHRYMRI